ncbi:MAG TPA: type II secretion system F family protein [Xanthomonadaceae bacterium]
MKFRALVSVAGRRDWLDIEAESTAAALVQAGRNGARVERLDVVDVEKKAEKARFTHSVFLQETLTLLRAGLNIVETMEALERKEPDPGFRRVLADVVRRLRQGATFSEALFQHAALFPTVLVAGVAASETSGGLADTLQRYLAYDEKIGQIRRKVISAAIYPALLMLVGGAVILFLLVYVLPKFSVILEGSGRSTADTTMLLVRTGQWIQAHPLLFATMLIGAFAIMAWLLISAPGRNATKAFLARVPVLSTIFATLGLSRLYRTLALLLDSGIPLSRALEMSKGVVPPGQSRIISSAILRLKGGETLTEALAGTSLIPPIAESLLRVGERSGELASMCDKLANFLDIALDRKVDAFTKLFEPILMAFIGAVIGVIVLAMYSPIFDLVGSVGQ